MGIGVAVIGREGMSKNIRRILLDIMPLQLTG